MAPSLAGSVELTFDDGPDPVWTPAVLGGAERLVAARDLLRHRAPRRRATRSSSRPFARRATRSSCTATSTCATPSVERATIEDDTRRALAALARLGVHPRRWRTPWGAQALVDRARSPPRHELELCGWDVDTHDWRGDGAEQMLAAVGPELHEGAVVLLHDGLGPGALRQGCEETVRFTRMIAAESVAA